MKWKMTNRFLMTVLSIVFIVIIVNIILLFAFLYSKSQNQSNTSAGDAIIHEFQTYVDVTSNEIIVNDAGLEHLVKHNAWAQFLDTNGHVVKNVLTGDLSLPTHYSPLELVHNYKYRDLEAQTTTYFAAADPYTILLGVKNPTISRNVLTLDSNFLVSLISEYLLMVIIIDIIVAILAGLLFGSILTKPLYRMIERIQQLKNQNYDATQKQKHGIYKNVFENLDEVAGDLKQQERERKRLEKMRNDWISNVSHDMKTPLASIQGYAELLKEDALLEEERKNYAEVIERQSKYMHELLEDFMLTLRLRNAELPLSKEVVSAEKFVREVVIDFLNDAQFSEYDVEFEAEANPQISIDKHLMKRALLNFLINACIHNPPSTKVNLRLIEANKQLQITIQDNGKGIRTEDLPNIFERYYRGTSTTDVQGSGLGMAISRDIFIAHNGEVAIESEQNIGTKIVMKLPFHE